MTLPPVAFDPSTSWVEVPERKTVVVSPVSSCEPQAQQREFSPPRSEKCSEQEAPVSASAPCCSCVQSGPPPRAWPSQQDPYRRTAYTLLPVESARHWPTTSVAPCHIYPQAYHYRNRGQLRTKHRKPF